MAFAFNLWAVVFSVIVAPVVVGLVGGALSRRWRPARPLAGLLIGLFVLWAVSEFLWPWGMLAEAGAYRVQILVAIGSGAVPGIVLLVRLAGARTSRPAA